MATNLVPLTTKTKGRCHVLTLFGVIFMVAIAWTNYYQHIYHLEEKEPPLGQLKVEPFTEVPRTVMEVNT